MTASRITAYFLAFGIGWILLSDWVLALLVSDPDGRSAVQSVKGILFVLLSAALVYGLVRAHEATQSHLEAQTARERDRLARVLNVSPAVIYSLLPQHPPQHLPHSPADKLRWQVDFVGPNVEALSGFAPDVWQRTPNLWRSRIHPDDLRAVMAAQARLIQEGRLSHEYRFMHADGHEVWIHDDVVVLRDAAGEPLQLTGAWLDVTDRKRAELATMDAQRRYRQLYEANPLPMWVVDLSTQAFVSVNTAAIQIYGYSEPEFLSMTRSDIQVAPQLACGSGSPDPAPLSSDLPPDHAECLHRKKDGTEFWVEVVAHEVEMEGLPCRLELNQDISAQLQAQAHQRLIANVFDASQEGIFITDGLCCTNPQRNESPLTPDGFIPQAPSQDGPVG